MSEVPVSSASGNLSRRVHNRLFRDTDESLCSRAWRLRSSSRFWSTWVRFCDLALGSRTPGVGHCLEGFQIHHHIRRLRHAIPPCDCPRNCPPGRRIRE